MPRPAAPTQSFEQIVAAQQRTVFGLLYRLTGSGDHLEDLAQEVFLRLFRALPEFRGDAAINTYLYRITVNVAQDEWQRRRRERAGRVCPPASVEDAGQWLEGLQPSELHRHTSPSPEQTAEAREMQILVNHCLQQLPAPERTALVLFHAEELDYAAVATSMQLPLNTVRTHLHRGRRRLVELVQQCLAPTPAHGIEKEVRKSR